MPIDIEHVFKNESETEKKKPIGMKTAIVS